MPVAAGAGTGGGEGEALPATTTGAMQFCILLRKVTVKSFRQLDEQQQQEEQQEQEQHHPPATASDSARLSGRQMSLAL